MNFLDFVNKRNIDTQFENEFFESFNEKDMEKVNELMLSLFKKKIVGQTILWKTPFDMTCDGKKMLSYRFGNTNNKDGKISNISIWSLNYLKSGDSNEVYSVDFYSYKNATELMWKGEAKSDLTIYTMGSSVAYFIPVICKIINDGNFKLSKTELEKSANTIFSKTANESKLYIGAFPYTVFEGLSDSLIDNTYFLNLGYVQEASELQNYRWKKKAERDEAYKHRNEPGGKEKHMKLCDEYNEIVRAIQGGATTINELKFAVKSGIKTTEDVSDDIKSAEEEVKKQKEDPEVAFKKMQIYVKSVIKGLQPGVILCGAPGIGKTYRVKQQLEANGYREGHNLYTIKGTESPRQLYIDMYEYKEKGKIIVIDDADALVGAKAPEVAINILKAALDSTASNEGRLVSYKVTGDLKDEEGTPIPKRMYFNAGVIIITNYNVGQLDTALRGRVFTQSLDFDTEQILGIIKNLIPGIDKQKLSHESKMKAYEYLVKLNKQGTNMELSIRTFAAAARLYQLCEGEDMTEEQVEEMIAEQMRNQAMRGGKHY